MTTSHIIFLIDLLNGFSKKDLTPAQGGSLYVPDGEKAILPAAAMIAAAHDSIFILAQDFHPADHISFASNHDGIEPFSNIFLRRDAAGQYRAAAAEVGGQIRAVDTDARGYITRVRDEVLSPDAIKNDLKQRVWLQHCEQDTVSSEFAPEIMAQLPKDLQRALREDMTSPVLSGKDKRGNSFYVVRKGMRSDLDSYGIATENDRISTTPAPALFAGIAQSLSENGVTDTAIKIGGLATNYCVAYSHDDIRRYLIPALQKRGITSELQLITDISYGIPDETLPDSVTRMTAAGTGLSTSRTFIHAMQPA